MKLPDFKNQEEAFAYALKGNADAVSFMSLLCTVLHIWDDLEDRDRELTRNEIDDAMYIALVVLPRNRFYQMHFEPLSVLLEVAIFNWHAANEMERTKSEDDKHIAFIARSDYCNLMIASARIVGGYAWAREITPFVRRLWHKEGFTGYLQNLQDQIASERSLKDVL